MQSIFQKIDSYNHNFLGFNLIGAFRNVGMWRRYIFLLTATALFAWVVLGWESTWAQCEAYMVGLPSVLVGQSTFGGVVAKAGLEYGVGQHLSSAVIYGVCFLLLSVHLEKSGVTKSLNFFLSTALSVFSVGVYEIIYNVLYSNLQGQAWTFTFAGRQGLNLSIFCFFIGVGAVGLVYLFSLGYRPRFSRITLVLLGLSVVTYVLWVFYPFPVTDLTVQTSAGAWSNTALFPQTMYAVNVDPAAGASAAIGTPYYVENGLLHLVNVLNKAFVSLTVLSFVMVTRRKMN